MFFLLTALLAHGADVDCLDPEVAIASAQDAFGEARLEDAQQQVEAAVSALGCARLPRPALVDLLHVQGALMLYDDDLTSATQALQAAKRLDAAAAPDLGSRVLEAWTAAEPDRSEPGAVQVEPTYTRWKVEVDGDRMVPPLMLPVGVHLLQVVDTQGQVHWGKLVRVHSGSTLALRTLTPEPAMPVAEPVLASTATAELPRSKAGRNVLRWGGVGLAGLGAASLALSAQQGSQLSSAETQEKLRAIRDREVGLGSAGLALVGVGAVGFGVSFAL